MDRIALENAGIDVAEALGRMMDNERLLSRLLGKFLDDGNYARLAHAIAAHDETGAFEASHTLKGVAGNLSMTTLHDLLSRQCDLFRNGAWDQAASLMPEIEDAYESVRTAIEAGL